MVVMFAEPAMASQHALIVVKAHAPRKPCGLAIASTEGTSAAESDVERHAQTQNQRG